MMTPAAASPGPWTCPFCPLACDHLGVGTDPATARFELQGGHCPRASAGLAQFTSHFTAHLTGVSDAATPAAEIDGQPVDIASAVSAAAKVLTASRQPLFAGLGADVDGARALYPLACATGAICDSAAGDSLMQGLRALQDRGQFTTTLAEVRARADVVVFIGGLPTAIAPLIGERCGIVGDSSLAERDVVVIGASAADRAQLDTWARPGIRIECIDLNGDLFDTLARLDALVGARPLPNAPAALQSLATRLRAARYGVLVGVPARLPAQGALIIEAVHRIVGQLNRSTRAAALWIGGGQGAATTNQVFTWLSGLPLRSRAGPLGLEHEPYAFDAQRLLAANAVDALLWVSSFDAAAAPPATALPLVVLGPVAMAASCRRRGVVFIAVSTPGIGCAGHVFRTDGNLLMPLRALRSDGLPTVADVVRQISAALPAKALV